MANNVYLLCEFSATQVSTAFLCILAVGFHLTISTNVLVDVSDYELNLLGLRVIVGDISF